ncbi:MAG: class I SAM-dependent methyltransferase [Acidobacteria bacterium]|nr:class I SAM-dependent methyltransferase [Acidobacteriota bacterium]
MRESLLRFYWRLQRILAPGLRSSQYDYFETVEQHLGPVTVWLDAGCGRALVHEWLEPGQAERFRHSAGRARFIIGADYDHESLRENTAIRHKFRGDIGRSLAVADRSVQLVTANMVVEHLSDPAHMLREVWRVLEPGGFFILHTPNLWNPFILASACIPASLKNLLIRCLDGREEKDAFPTRYRLNTPWRIASLAAETGFAVQELKTVRTAAVLAMLGPVVIPELLLARALALPAFARFRPDVIAVLQKPQGATATSVLPLAVTVASEAR